MEGIPSPERMPVKRSEVVSKLQELGPDSLEATRLLKEWVDQEQEKVEKGEIDQYDFDLSWGGIYEEAGMIEDAIEHYEQLAGFAERIGRDEIAEACKVRISAINLTRH
jgi:hypothetical protein